MSGPARTFPLWLSLSVLLNFLLVGLVVGYLVARPAEAPRPDGPGGQAGLRSEIALGRGILEVTPPSERRQLARSFREALTGSGGQVRDRLRARNAILAALEAEDFDTGAIEAALGQLQAADQRLQDALHEQLVEALGELTPEQRQELAMFIREDAARRSAVRRGFRERRPVPTPVE